MTQNFYFPTLSLYNRTNNTSLLKMLAKLGCCVKTCLISRSTLWYHFDIFGNIRMSLIQFCSQRPKLNYLRSYTQRKRNMFAILFGGSYKEKEIWDLARLLWRWNRTDTLFQFPYSNSTFDETFTSLHILPIIQTCTAAVFLQPPFPRITLSKKP